MSDPGLTYRSREEVAKIRKERDPIENLKGIILDHKLASADEIKKIDSETKDIIDDAVEKARAAELPDENVLLEDVYIEKDPYFIRGIEFDDSRFPQGGKYWEIKGDN